MAVDKTTNREKIKIIGLGPGNLDYLLPVCKRAIDEADILVGGKRNIESLEGLTDGKEIRYIDRHLKELIEGLKESRSKNIVMVVSGDTGFYSMLEFMKKNFNTEDLDTYPGISSIQYLFARSNLSWFDALVKSVHGREFDFELLMKEYTYLGLLTDNKNTPQKIAKRLCIAGYGKKIVIVGEDLSYSYEKISSYTADELSNIEREFNINAVIVEGDLNGTH